jgi:hypothetical protein
MQRLQKIATQCATDDAARGSRRESARRDLDCVEHATRIDVMDHVARARRNHELGAGDVARERDGVARRIDVAVLRARDNDRRDLERAVPALHAQGGWDEQRGVLGRRAQLRGRSAIQVGKSWK